MMINIIEKSITNNNRIFRKIIYYHKPLHEF